MSIAYAFFLDLFIGDPRYRLHPVRLMGKLARLLEQNFNSKSPSIFAGLCCCLFLYLLTGCLFYFLEKQLSLFEYGVVIEIILFYTTIALHDLLKHGYRVYRCLKNDDIAQARVELSYIVGRKTKKLNSSEICRGVLESLSENLVDGVTAPLFYGIIFGLPGAFIYKMINTLDSLWGHKNERYQNFGYVAAKIDDLANYIPARITSPIIIIIGSLFTFRLKEGFKILKRDGRKHPSPNSGLSEAAIAGVLGVRLGGENHYDGYVSRRPFMGDKINELSIRQIEITFFICLISSNVFLLMTSLIFNQILLNV